MTNRVKNIIFYAVIGVCFALLVITRAGCNQPNQNQDLHIKISVLEAQRAELVKRAVYAETRANHFAQLAAENQSKRNTYKTHYIEKANSIYSIPFPIRASVFARQLNRLDSITQNGN